MPNQEHNYTVWLIQYSYAVDYYFMIYKAHFFALILPHKVQYKEILVTRIFLLPILTLKRLFSMLFAVSRVQNANP